MSYITTTKEVFGVRLKELRKQNGYTIEQFAAKIGVAKSTVGYYENDNRMPDIEILSRICDVFNVPADYLLGRTNTAAVKGKMKTVCDLTGLSDTAAEFMSELLKDRRYDVISKLNYLLEDYANDYNEDYDVQWRNNLENTSSILNALFHYMKRYSKFDSLLDYLEVYDPKDYGIREVLYRELLIRRIINAVKVGTEEYKQQNRPWE